MERSALGPFELVALAALGSCLAVSAALLVVAGLAGLLFGDGWAGGSLAEMPGVLTRLPDQIGDPRQAWPSVEAARLPGPFGFYVAGLIVIAGVSSGAMLGFRMRARFTNDDAARWARRHELKPLRVKKPTAGRITLGHDRVGLIAAERGQSVLAIAPTQSGKTTGLAIPNILEWQGPVIALSVKNDLLRDTLKRRGQMGRVAVFDPTGVTGLDETSSWTPLLGCRTWAGARRVARSLADGAAGKRSLTDGDFWFSAAAKLLAPLLYAAATSGLTMDAVVEWVDTQEEIMVHNALEAAGDPSALNAHRATWSRDERQRSSIYTTAETVLEAYADPGVLEHSRVPDIESRWLLDGGAHTLYLCASGREQRRLRPVFVALLEEMIEAAYAEVGVRGEPLNPPLLIVLDEVANTAPLPDLDALASTAASHGIQLITILQDLAQAHDRWGRERAETIVNNHRGKLLGAGLTDERALSWASRLLGDTSLTQTSQTMGESARRTTTLSQTYRPLAPAHALRQERPGSALLVYGMLPPARIRLRPWYLDS